ncbi:MAG: hypothetical protein ACHP79_01190 [Terriglobales bacterium]
MVRFWLVLLITAVVVSSVSCGSNQATATSGIQPSAPVGPLSADCTLPDSALTAGTTRVYIALRNGQDGSGHSADDARDGSTATSFDTILRCFAEGCASPAVAKTDNLMVCLGPGTFATRGNYDARIDIPHLTPNGFTLGNGWKIHGQGAANTTVQLSDYLPITDPSNLQGLPVGSGANVVFSTQSHSVSQVEISDLTIDANYASLKQTANASGIFALNLEAIHVWSSQGGNWIHNVKVINAAGEIGGFDESFETSTVMIISAAANSKPSDSSGNVIENVTMSGFGGGACTAMVMANATGEVRHNAITGYQIGYGGWTMGAVHFHDNVAQDTIYGFNIDALANDGVIIESNQINNPHSYGIVVGGGGTYRNITISGNTIHMGAGASGILLQGNVINSVLKGNTIVAESGAPGGTGILNFSNLAGAGANSNNVYQSNVIDNTLSVVFRAPSLRTTNCAFGNRDQNGNPRGDLPDTSGVPCVP